MKKILITGGAGFIGSHLCEKLLEQNHQILCLDNLYTGWLSNIEHLQKNPYFTFINQDVCFPIDVEVDEIYNLASPASPTHYQKDPLFTTRTCILGSLNVLELAKKNQAKILQASTSEVYGDPQVHPQPEAYWGYVNPIGPRSCYDEGKRCAETLFFDYKRIHGVDCKIARIFNTYGPRMQTSDGRVISNFIKQALQNEPLTIYGEGKQTRSFSYVDDLVSGLILFMESPFAGPMNLGNPEEMNIETLAKLIIAMTNSSSKLEYQPLPEDDPKLRCPDIRLAKEKLGWIPEISIEKGLRRTIETYLQITKKEMNKT